MKILHIIPNLKKGGAERLVIDIVRALAADQSVQIKLILFENKIEYQVDDLLSCIEIVPSSVQLSVLRKNTFEINKLQQSIENFNPEIIHTHLFQAEIISRSCFFPEAHWFSHSHDRMKSLNNLNFKALTSKKKLTDYYERKYLLQRYKKNGGTHFIAISKDIESFLKSVLPSNIGTVNRLENAIDTNRFKRPTSSEEKSLNQPFKLISIGRLDANKNHQFLLDRMKDLKEQGLPFHLTIVGDGDQREILENKINYLNLQLEVTLAGVIDNVEELLWESDIYVHSAYTEGFGLTLIEAMAAGLPVVSTNGNGNKDLIRDEYNGYMCDLDQKDIFVARIVDIIKDKSLYNSMSNNALSFASTFDINQYISKLLKLYKQAN